MASYKILASLYTLGTDTTLTHDRKYLKTEFERHKPALGSCLGAFSSCFPVAFLEPHSNKNNPFSLLNRIADHSLEAQDILVKMESSMPTLETILQEVEQYVESEKVIQSHQFVSYIALRFIYFLDIPRSAICYRCNIATFVLISSFLVGPGARQCKSNIR